jgi:hypothetical protein
MRRELIILFLLSMHHFAFGQNTTIYPQYYFHSPLDTPLTISGGYGEPRGRAFHWGVDFKTHATVGHNVYASADGYVCRIKVSPFGYGKAIYIMHPNGYMTVYGHLLKYRDDIAEYVKKIQYSKQSFDIDIFLQPKQFPVHQGDIIGLSGTSGGSTGPHLHFEIRDASGETYPLNPLQFGLPVKDTIPPTLTSLAVYLLDNKGKTPDFFTITKKDNSYKLKDNTIVVSSRNIGFGISAYDCMSDSADASQYGIYSLEEKFDDTVIYAFQLDRLDFTWGAYANGQIDYHENLLNDKQYYLCYTLPGGILPLITHNINNGIITLHDSKPHHVSITTKDSYGNASSLNFMVQFGGYNNATVTPEIHFDQYFPYDKENNFTGSNSQLIFPKGCLFDNLYFQYKESDTVAKNIYSKLFYIHNPYTPLKSVFTLQLKPDSIPQRLKSRALICYKDENGNVSGIPCTWLGNYLTAKPKVLGEYFISVDTSPPVIRALTVNARGELTRRDSIEFKITDHLSGIDSYIGTIDGKWVLLDYDAKNDLLSLNLDDVKSGVHEFELEVSDDDHNQSSYILKFKK